VARVALWFAVAAGLLDVVENVLLLRTANHLQAPERAVVLLTGAAAGAKFLLLVAPVVVAVWMLVRLALAWVPNLRTIEAFQERMVASDAESRARLVLPKQSLPAGQKPEQDQPTAPAPPRPFKRVGTGSIWDVPLPDGAGPLEWSNKRYGICLSGGGIRSATFGLGALQHLEGLPAASEWWFRKSDYLSAVSGGSYIAATYQFLARGSRSAGDLAQAAREVAAPAASEAAAPAAPEAAAPAPLIKPTGQVENHLRRYATHLADGAKEWLLALGEVLAKALSGLAILLAVIWVIAVPLGWLYRAWLHGLDQDGQPSPTLNLSAVLVVVAVFAVLLLLRLAALVVTRSVTADARRVVRQALMSATLGAVALVIVVPFLAPKVESLVTDAAQLAGIAKADSDVPRRSEVLAHLSALSAATTTVSAKAAATAAAVSPALTNLPGGQPGAAAAADAAKAAALDAAIATADAASEGARLAAADLQRSILGDGAPARLTIPPVTDLSKLCQRTASPSDPPAGLVTLACRAANASSKAASAAAVVAKTATVNGGEPAVTAAALKTAAEAAGAAAEAETIIDELSADPDPPLAWAGLSALVTVIGGLVGKRRLDVGKGSAPKKKKRGTSIARKLGFGGIGEVIAGIGCAVVLAVAFSDVIVDAWRRGPRGPIVDTHSDLLGWAGVVAVLAIALALVNVNTWSLRGFYHRRLWLAYAATPDGETADWQTDTKLSELAKKTDNFPELVICAAAQTSGRKWASPGRRAVPFVFTANGCGSPRTRYVVTRELENYLGDSYRSPLTLFGAVATSGAAFGPAMGRQSKGGLGAVLAIANARLGAWLPNPLLVYELADVPQKDWRIGALPKRPGLLWWFREIAGRYPLDNSMVLTSDGGHIENLGLLELFRRRCTRILCFDASGAGATPTTLAEAIVLAREELDVQVELYAPNGDPLLDTAAFGADPLRRALKDEPTLAERLARFPVLVGRVRYPPDKDGARPSDRSHGRMSQPP